MATTRQSKSKHSLSAGKNTDDLDASANNQKPGDECGTCSVVVGANNKALSCEICDKWYHIKCESIPESVYNFMLHDEAGKQLIWHCSYCQRGCVKVYKHMKIIVADQLELKTKQNVLQEEKKTVRECITQEIGAMKDIEARETAELTPEETRKQDITTFMQIVNICGAPIQEQDVLDCRRLGQTVTDKNKHRPVLIKLVSEEKKRNLFVRLGAWRKYQQEHRGPEEITAGKPLINTDHDMTQEQRKDRRSLVEEAKNLNAKLPVDVKTRWTVRGSPWNMRVLKVILVPPNPNHQ
ncbi:hypothetical protein Pcinc_004989 [Petrolisthes cinctipes]|uniref:PHD-type domain-containing protein n=1 Tax=Petrolisthes cinctipes TaxID=88211 RepID=A0AAE1GED1_PETCI|nr:hypothetical protein Pcinc_004982 [Petrolisthes cinctipes]KAK3891120.1 hypothetical protein Pcinc_004989 [Petrolisthes cinctipes]